MKKIFFCFIFCIGSILCFSQKTSIIDSLEEVSQRLPESIEHVDVLNELSYLLRSIDSTKAKNHAIKSLKIADKLGYTAGMGSSHFRLAMLYKIGNNPVEAKAQYNKALALRKKVGVKKDIASCYNSLGLLEKLQGNYQAAKVYYFKGLSILEKETDSKLKGKINNNLGSIFKHLGKYDEAIDYYQQSLVIRKKLNDSKGEAFVKLNLGFLYLELKNDKRAGSYATQSLEIFETLGNNKGKAKCYNLLGNNASFLHKDQEALTYYDKALEFQKSLLPEDLAVIYQNKGSAYVNLGEYELAYTNYIFALEIQEALGNKPEIATINYSIGVLHFNHGNGKEKLAIEYLEKSLSYFKKKADPELKSKILFFLSSAHSWLQEHQKALAYNKLYVTISDSLHLSYKKAMTNQLNLEEELRATAITELNLTNEKNRLTKIIALIVFLLLLVLVYIMFQNNRISKQKQRLSEQNEQIVIQKNTKLLAEKELETTYARLEGQDSERKRIAQDLHDRLGSMLSTVKLFFAAVDSKINEYDEENQNHFQKANDLLDEACDEVRRVSHDMESGILTKFGLQAELEALTSTIMETKQIKVELVTHGLNERLDNILEVKSYRIIQELVNNVLKHAKANKITIQLNRFNDVLNIMVEDDGVGFEPESINKRDGMGLNNVTSRVHGMNGTLAIDADKGNGTTISIDIPCCT